MVLMTDVGIQKVDRCEKNNEGQSVEHVEISTEEIRNRFTLVVDSRSPTRQAKS
jgi:hypothetical protein